MKDVPSNELRYEQSPLFEIDYSSSSSSPSSKNLVRMNLNENIVFPQNQLRSAIAKCSDKLDARYYPSEQDKGDLKNLRAEIAQYCKCSSASVALGVGSDQILDLVFRSTLSKTTGKLTIIEPTYSMYSVLARRLGVRVRFVKLGPSTTRPPFSLPVTKVIITAKKEKASVLVLASPNNPTGIQYPVDEIRTLIESLPETRILIDEAYVEYGNYSAVSLMNRAKQNLVIIRTFSKAFGLAALRLGYLISSDVQFVDRLTNEFQYPYPITQFSVLMALEMLKRNSLVLEVANKTKIFRAELIDSLQKLGDSLRVVPRSDANFVLVKSERSKKIAEELLTNYAIAVKYLPKLGAEKEFLRITVGSRETNQRLLYALRRIVAS